MAPSLNDPDTLTMMTVFNSALGPFFGALFAFFVNLFLLRQQRRRENKAAGNLAMATLSRMYGDFLIAKSAIQHDLKTRKDLAACLQIRPTIFEFSESLTFDLKALTFLFEQGQTDLLDQLLLVQVKYHDLRNLLRLNNDAAWERDKYIVDGPGFNVKDDAILISKGDEGVVLGLIPDVLQIQLQNYHDFLVSRAVKDESAYTAAGASLQQLMTSKFCKKDVMQFRAHGAKSGLAASS